MENSEKICYISYSQIGMDDSERLLCFQVAHSPTAVMVNHFISKCYSRLYWEPNTNKSKIQLTYNILIVNMDGVKWNWKHRPTFRMRKDNNLKWLLISQSFEVITLDSLLLISMQRYIFVHATFDFEVWDGCIGFFFFILRFYVFERQKEGDHEQGEG